MGRTGLNMLTLDVAISTYKPEGIERVTKMLSPLAPQEGVRYIVSWQEHQEADVPEYLVDRQDVEVYRLDIKGLSNNRNNAIDHCNGDVILIADDDLEYYPDFAQKVLNPFQENKELDLATFKIDFLNKKTYPYADCNLKIPLPKNYYVTSMEIAFRRESINDLRFWPELGLGAPSMHCGEEEFFIFNAIKINLNCKFINSVIAIHPSDTTGNSVSKGTLSGQGFIIRKYYPLTMPIRLLIKAWRLKKTKKNPFFKSLIYLSKGAFYYYHNLSPQSKSKGCEK